MIQHIQRFLHKHHRGLIVVVMLFLTAQTCLICEYAYCSTQRRVGDEISTSLNVQPGTTSVGEVAELNYAVTLPYAGRYIYSSKLELTLPPGVEFILPVQPVFTSSSNSCTVAASNASSLQLESEDEPCPIRVNIRATSFGSFTLRATLWLDEEIEYGLYWQTTHDYVSETTFTVTGSIFVSKQFNPVEVKQGETSTMTIALTNDSSIPVTGVRFEDPMPAGMTLLAVTGNTCPGSIISTASNTLTFRDGRLEANTSCQITAMVRGDGAGNLFNTTSFVSAVEFNYSNQGQASLNVLAPTSTPLPPPPEEPTGPVCGNRICEAGENLEICPLDCDS